MPDLIQLTILKDNILFAWVCEVVTSRIYTYSIWSAAPLTSIIMSIWDLKWPRMPLTSTLSPQSSHLLQMRRGPMVAFFQKIHQRCAHGHQYADLAVLFCAHNCRWPEVRHFFFALSYLSL